jgi:hypothetical protein
MLLISSSVYTPHPPLRGTFSRLTLDTSNVRIFKYQYRIYPILMREKEEQDVNFQRSCPTNLKTQWREWHDAPLNALIMHHIARLQWQVC